MSDFLEFIQARIRNGAEISIDDGNCEASLLAVVEGDSLDTKISEALSLRQQGQLNRAIVLITEANRKQLDAIEGIQRIMDSLLNRPHSEVVFAKYRQFPPFKMGIEGADDVLKLLASLDVDLAIDHGSTSKKLHTLEGEKKAETERLAFFEQRFADGSEAETINAAHAAIQMMTADIAAVKRELVQAVVTTVHAYLPAMGIPEANFSARCELSKWLYVLATSPTKTRHAEDVSVEA